MKRALQSLAVGVVFWATPFYLAANPDWSTLTGDVVILGEFHDNPTHHKVQAAALLELAPKAVVFEMLTPDEAQRLDKIPRDRSAIEAMVEGFHWSNITAYADVLAASPVILGAALPREDMRGAFSDGAATVFGAEAPVFGLTTPVPKAQLEERKQLQFEAHCEAMPLEMMGGMVEAQRLRDAAFARATLAALDTYGAPVVLITGNGHARTDWGVPAYLEKARPTISVTSIAQGEAGHAPAGTYDLILADAPSPKRGDPCAAFR